MTSAALKDLAPATPSPVEVIPREAYEIPPQYHSEPRRMRITCVGAGASRLLVLVAYKLRTFTPSATTIIEGVTITEFHLTNIDQLTTITSP